MPSQQTQRILIVKASSAGYGAGDFAEITLNDIPVKLERNSNQTYRGLHIVLLSQTTGEVVEARVFDTYRSSAPLETFIDSSIPGENCIIVAACKDECFTNLSDKVKDWFRELGSLEIMNLQYR